MSKTVKALPDADAPSHERRSVSIQERTGLSSSAIIGAGVLLVTFFASDIPAWMRMYEAWMTNPDNSHGVLVPFFSLWLLWNRRGMLPSSQYSISWAATLLGSTLIFAGIGIRCAGVYTGMHSLQATSIVVCIAGIVLCCGGFVAARWAWPGVLFLIFMIPLPAQIGGLLSNVLQNIATVCSTYVLQTIGIPAISEGNVIWLTEKSLGVAEACSGIRMLTSFFALAVGVGLVIDRPVWQKCIIIASAPIIAVIANILRISVTAIAYEFGNEKMAELIFHDLAGWLMMPVGLLLLWLELLVVSKLFLDDDPQNLGFGNLRI